MSILLKLISVKWTSHDLSVFIYLHDQFRPTDSLISIFASIPRGIHPFLVPVKSLIFNVYGIAIKYKFWNAHLNCLEIEICFLFNRGIFEPYKSFFPSKLGKFVGLKYDDYKYTYNIVCILWDIVRIIR